MGVRFGGGLLSLVCTKKFQKVLKCCLLERKLKLFTHFLSLSLDVASLPGCGHKNANNVWLAPVLWCTWGFENSCCANGSWSGWEGVGSDTVKNYRMCTYTNLIIWILCREARSGHAEELRCSPQVCLVFQRTHSKHQHHLIFLTMPEGSKFGL